MKWSRFLAVWILLSSCQTNEPTTFTPIHITQTAASFDGNEQNSGVKGFVDGKGFELTPSAAQRYIDLGIKFKEATVPILHEDGKLFLNKEGMVQFLELADKNLQ